MSKKFRDEVDSAVYRALGAFGFQLQRRGSPCIRIDDSFYGWVGLNRSGVGDAVRIDPFIGVHCVPVMRMFYELDFYRNPKPKYVIGDTATISIHIGMLSSELRPFIFESDEPLESEAGRLAESVVKYGLPWMRAHASLNGILDRLREREAILNGVPERIAITLFLLGQFEELIAYLDRKRDEFAQHPGWAATNQAWPPFCAALRDRMSKDGEA